MCIRDRSSSSTRAASSNEVGTTTCSIAVASTPGSIGSPAWPISRRPSRSHHRLPAPADVRVVSTANLAGGQVLTVSVPHAARGTVLPASAFDVTVNGRHTATAVDRLPPMPVDLALVVDSTSAAPDAALQAAGNGLVELLPQLPAGSRVGGQRLQD